MLRFDQFLIRPIELKDIVSYFELIERNRERLQSYFPITTKTCADLGSTKQYIESRIERGNKKEFITLVISDEETKKLAGAISIKDIDWINLKSELGYFIDLEYANKGITSKSISLVTKFCFEQLKLNKVFLRIASDNHSSRRVAEKNNFNLEGILLKDLQTNPGNFKDVAYYGLLKQDFQ